MDFVVSKDLVYEYKQYNEEEDNYIKFRALDGININIPKGQFVVVLGHNGSGKSTFAKHLNALLLPSDGKLIINGYDTKDESNLWNIRQSAGMVFQNPDNQLIATIVEEDIAFGPENLGVESSEIYKRVDESLNSVNMQEFRNNAPHLLSGGQKQRIAIAGILAMKPDCIVLDEPTAMLDPVGRKEVIETITKLNKEENITIILITHYMEEAVNADRVVVVEKGKIVMDDIPKKIFMQVEKMKMLRLDVPQVTELAFNLNKKGFKIDKDILKINEMTDALFKIGFKEDKINITDKSEENKNIEPIIEIKDLSYIYSPNTAYEKKALDNINLTIGKGEFIGVIGHTGSGKSTLIQHLNSLMKPTKGSIFINGEDINADKNKLKQIRQKVGLVFQYPEHQLFETTIYKDVSFGPENMGLNKEEIDKRVKEALNIVGLDEKYYNKSPFELSGGQKRRVAIAGVLAMKPEILILDEPTAGLDPYGRDEILNNIKIMHDNMKITVILVSHSMEDISKLVDRIIVMHRGNMEFFGTPSYVFKHSKRLEEIGLSVPQISSLMNELKQRGIDIPNNIYTINEAEKILEKMLNNN